MITDKEQTDLKLSTQQKILNAAREEFIERGYEGARIQRIADNSGANKAMIYYYFTSKKELYRRVITNVFGGALGQIRGIFEVEMSVEEKIKALVDFYVSFYRSNTGFVRLMLREIASNSPVLTEVLEELKDTIKGYDYPVVVETRLLGINSGIKVRDVDPRHTMMSLVSMCVGFFIFRPVASAILSLSPEEAERFAAERSEHISDLLLHGILKS
jgi:TetR/AcrR family transcriptional regulator